MELQFVFYIMYSRTHHHSTCTQNDVVCLHVEEWSPNLYWKTSVFKMWFWLTALGTISTHMERQIGLWRQSSSISTSMKKSWSGKKSRQYEKFVSNNRASGHWEWGNFEWGRKQNKCRYVTGACIHVWHASWHAYMHAHVLCIYMTYISLTHLEHCSYCLL